MQEKLVELCSLHSHELAEEIILRLREEGLHPFLRNEYSNQFLGHMVHIGLPIDLPESEVEQALTILAEAGIHIDQLPTAPVSQIARWSDRLPILAGRPLEQRLWMLLISVSLLLLLLIGIVYLIAYLNGIS